MNFLKTDKIEKTVPWPLGHITNPATYNNIGNTTNGYIATTMTSEAVTNIITNFTRTPLAKAKAGQVGWTGYWPSNLKAKDKIYVTYMCSFKKKKLKTN